MGRSLHDDSLRPTQNRDASTAPSLRDVSQDNRERSAKSIYQSRDLRYASEYPC